MENYIEEVMINIKMQEKKQMGKKIKTKDESDHQLKI